jgi:signal transduction histidine kinase
MTFANGSSAQIPGDKRARIFERFYQAHDTTYRSGMGLGLYVSRQIVELHGGEICAEFPADGGTRMTVRLPIALPSVRASVAAD